MESKDYLFFDPESDEKKTEQLNFYLKEYDALRSEVKEILSLKYKFVTLMMIAFFLGVTLLSMYLRESKPSRLYLYASFATVGYIVILTTLNRFQTHQIALVSRYIEIHLMEGIKAELDINLGYESQISLLVPAGKKSMTISSSINKWGKPASLKNKYFERSEEVEGLAMKYLKPVFVNSDEAQHKSAYYGIIDKDHAFRSSVFVPIKVRDDIVGLVSIDSTGVPENKETYVNKLLTVLKKHERELAKAASSIYGLST